MTRERPKEIKKAEPAKTEKKVAVVGESGFFKSLLARLGQGLGAGKAAAYHPRIAALTPRQHPSKFFAEKREGKHGGFKDWELNKIWAPSKNKEGGIFVAQSTDSRQQRRAREYAEAYKYMAEHFGGEPRRIRREMARARTRLFRKTERELAGKLAEGRA